MSTGVLCIRRHCRSLLIWLRDWAGEYQHTFAASCGMTRLDRGTERHPCSLVSRRAEPDHSGSSSQRPLGLSSRVAFCLSVPLLIMTIRHPCWPDYCSPVPKKIEIAGVCLHRKGNGTFHARPRCIYASSLKGGCPNDENRFHRGGSRSGADDCSAHYSG